MANVNYYDKTSGQFLGAMPAESNWTAPDNYVATTVALPDGLNLDAHFDNGAWRAATDDEHKAWLALQTSNGQSSTPVPTDDEQVLMQQATDLAQLKQLVMQQAATIATLTPKGSAE